MLQPEFLLVVVLALSVALYVKMRAVLRLHPSWKLPLVLAAIATLGGMVAIYPRVGELKPPFSESPSGLFVIVGRLIVLGPIALAALATLVAAATTRTDRSAEP